MSRNVPKSNQTGKGQSRAPNREWGRGGSAANQTRGGEGGTGGARHVRVLPENSTTTILIHTRVDFSTNRRMIRSVAVRRWCAHQHVATATVRRALAGRPARSPAPAPASSRPAQRLAAHVATDGSRRTIALPRRTKYDRTEHRDETRQTQDGARRSEPAHAIGYDRAAHPPSSRAPPADWPC